MINIFGLSFVFFLAYAAAHILLCRFMSPAFFIRKAAYLWLCIVVAAHGFSADNFYGFSLGLFFSFSFWCLYILVLVAARNSVTLRMMDEIDLEGELSRSALGQRFQDKHSVEARLCLMEQNQIVSRNSAGQTCLTPKGRRFAKLAMLIRRVFGIEKAG